MVDEEVVGNSDPVVGETGSMAFRKIERLSEVVE